jgi:hypothetical protein
MRQSKSPVWSILTKALLLAGLVIEVDACMLEFKHIV